MKSNYEIEKLADWHYDPFAASDDDLVFLDVITFNAEDKKGIKAILKDPITAGGVKRIHIGDPAIKVDNTNINSRSSAMKLVGYTDHDHFIEFNNTILDGLASFMKDHYKLDYEHHCAILVKPGQCMPVHGDTYSYLMKMMKEKHPEVKYDLKTDARRYMVFLTPWTWGQSFGAGNAMTMQWKEGEVYSWKHKLLHWCSNSSLSPLLFFEITGLEIQRENGKV